MRPSYVTIKYVLHRMFHVISTTVNAAVDVTIHAIEAGWLRTINNNTEVKKKKYINFRDHQRGPANKIVDTGSPVITEVDGKLISGRGYFFNRFLLNVHCPNEINQQ